MNGTIARPEDKSSLAWEDALKNCFRGNITLSFETGRQNRMIISKAAIWTLNTPTFVDLLIDQRNLSLLLLGTEYQSPYSIRVSGIGSNPLCQHRQQLLASTMDHAGWRKGYRYTISAIILDVADKPALSFDMQRALMQAPSRLPGVFIPGTFSA